MQDISMAEDANTDVQLLQLKFQQTNASSTLYTQTSPSAF